MSWGAEPSWRLHGALSLWEPSSAVQGPSSAAVGTSGGPLRPCRDLLVAPSGFLGTLLGRVGASCAA
eukprot:3013254-Pyramimonas_sp.AAC.1